MAIQATLEESNHRLLPYDINNNNKITRIVTLWSGSITSSMLQDKAPAPSLFCYYLPETHHVLKPLPLYGLPQRMFQT